METLEEGMGGLAKGLAIAESFDRDHPRLTVTDAATLTGQTPAAARRCMRTLEALGYLSYDGKYFQPTPRFVRLANVFTETDPLPRLATPLLAELRDEFGESASLGVLDGHEVLFVARAGSHHLVATGQRVGGRLAAARSAAGRVLLNGLDDTGAIRAIDAGMSGPRTLKALTDPRSILAEVRTGGERGFCLTDEEVEIGLRAVAVPVADSDGRLVAAMSLSVLTARASVERVVDEFVPGLRRAAARLGMML